MSSTAATPSTLGPSASTRDAAPSARETDPVMEPLVEMPRGSGPPATAERPEAPEDDAPYGEPRLWSIPSNPVPPGTRVAVLEVDGLRLRYALFRPASAGAGKRGRGTIVLLQGRNEYIEKYFETARDLAARGFMVMTFDWRGQGGSERLLPDPQRGYVRSFRDYERDLDAMIERVVLPDCRAPFTIVGHSTGALIALLAASRHRNRIERIVALAPMLRLTNQPLGPAAIRWITGFLRLVGLGKRYVALGRRAREVPDYLSNVLTTDRTRHERNGAMLVEHYHLGLGGPTVTWLHAASRAMRRCLRERHLRTVSIPSLMIVAGDDMVVSNRAIEAAARGMRNSNVVTVDGARHELLQERDRYRGQVLAAIEAFAAKPFDG